MGWREYIIPSYHHAIMPSCHHAIIPSYHDTIIMYQLKMALTPWRIRTIKGCDFHSLYKKVTQNHFYHHFMYVNDVPCHMKLRSFVGCGKRFGSLRDDRCTGSWYVGNFAPHKFSTIEPGLQFYGDVPRNTRFNECEKYRRQCSDSTKNYYEYIVRTCGLHNESKQHTKMCMYTVHCTLYTVLCTHCAHLGACKKKKFLECMHNRI